MPEQNIVGLMRYPLGSVLAAMLGIRHPHLAGNIIAFDQNYKPIKRSKLVWICKFYNGATMTHSGFKNQLRNKIFNFDLMANIN